MFCDNTLTGKIRCKEITSIDKQEKDDCQSDIGCNIDVYKRQVSVYEDAEQVHPGVRLSI